MHQPRLSHQTPLQGLRAPQALPAASRQAKERKGKMEEAKKGGVAGKDEDGFPDPDDSPFLIIFTMTHKMEFASSAAFVSVT